MGYYCTVPQCTSLAGKTKNVKFHRFPRDVTMADKWNIILKRGKPYTKYSKVCSLHFTQADYNVTTMGQWKTLSKDAVPTQNLPKLNADGTVMVIRKSRTIKYREGKKEDNLEKSEKWMMPVHHPAPIPPPSHEAQINNADLHDAGLAYRLQTLSAIASSIAPQQPTIQSTQSLKPKKQDAIMQTDPVQSEEDDSQTFEDEKPLTDTVDQYPIASPYPKDTDNKIYDAPKDYTKTEDDYIPQTNEEYNNEAEKYALERKSHNGYEKVHETYPKSVPIDYQKVDVYPNFDKYPNRTDNWYPNGFQDSVEMLRNQQHNLQILQEQHRINENQNFFNENHIKQEIDINGDEDKFIYERNKDQLDSATIYEEQRRSQQQRLLEHLQQQVKQEPDASGCENVMQPQSSPYYATNGHNSVTNGYYDQLSRPGPELLIAKQNALAAHTQLWQNTMKRPFFYSESPHYNSTAPLIHRYETGDGQQRHRCKELRPAIANPPAQRGDYGHTLLVGEAYALQWTSTG